MEVDQTTGMSEAQEIEFLERGGAEPTSPEAKSEPKPKSEPEGGSTEDSTPPEDDIIADTADEGGAESETGDSADDSENSGDSESDSDASEDESDDSETFEINGKEYTAKQIAEAVQQSENAGRRTRAAAEAAKIYNGETQKIRHYADHAANVLQTIPQAVEALRWPPLSAAEAKKMPDEQIAWYEQASANVNQAVDSIIQAAASQPQAFKPTQTGAKRVLSMGQTLASDVLDGRFEPADPDLYTGLSAENTQRKTWSAVHKFLTGTIGLSADDSKMLLTSDATQPAYLKLILEAYSAHSGKAGKAKKGKAPKKGVRRINTNSAGTPTPAKNKALGPTSDPAELDRREFEAEKAAKTNPNAPKRGTKAWTLWVNRGIRKGW